MIGPSNVADDRFDFGNLLDAGQEFWAAEKIFALGLHLSLAPELTSGRHGTAGLHRQLVGGLTQNYCSHATPRILHVTTTPRDQMDMRVANRLSGDFAAIYTNVEPRHQTVH